MLPIEKRRDIARKNRESILKSAIALFQEKGFDNVSIDDIGKAAGFSRGTIYKLFDSKEDIVATYMAQWNTLYVDYYHEELEHSDLDALEKFRLLSTYMLTASTQGGQALQRVASASAMRDELLAEKVSTTGKEIDRILRQLLAEGVETGIITKRYPIEQILYLTYAMAEGVALRWAGQYNEEGIEDAANSAMATLTELFRSAPGERNDP